MLAGAGLACEVAVWVAVDGVSVDWAAAPVAEDALLAVVVLSAAAELVVVLDAAGGVSGVKASDTSGTAMASAPSGTSSPIKTGYFIRPPQPALPTTTVWRSVVFHRYPDGFQIGSPVCTAPLASVARTARV